VRTALAILLCSAPLTALGQPVVEILSPRGGDCVNGGLVFAQDVEPGGEPLVPATDLTVRLRLTSPVAGALEVTLTLDDEVVGGAQVPVEAAGQAVEAEVSISADQLVDGADRVLRVAAASGGQEGAAQATIDIDRTPPTVVFEEADIERAGACLEGAAPEIEYEVVDALDDAPEVDASERRAGCLAERVVVVRDHCVTGEIAGNAARVVFPTRHGPAGAFTVALEARDGAGEAIGDQGRVVAANLSFEVDAGEGCVEAVEARLLRDGQAAGFFGQGQRIDTPGTYVASVEATPCGGDAVRAERRFTVVPPPSADPGGPYEAAQGAELVLDGSGSQVDPAFGRIDEYAWDVDGDGFFDEEEGREPTVVFDTLQGDGAYRVGLRVTTDRGPREFAYTTVTLVDVSPVCDAGGPYEIAQGLEVVIDASGSAAGHETEPVIAYDFDFGDERFPVRGVFPRAGHRYVDEGEYTVTLRVEDIDSACEDTATVTVLDVEPEIRGLAARSAGDLLEGGVVVFTAGLTSAGSAAEPLTELRWDFGDDSPIESGANLRDPSHEYTESGVFDVCLEVDDVDSTVRACILVVVADLEPFARLDGPRFALEGHPETFSARGSRAGGDADPLRRYVWDFGDGSEPVVVEDLAQTEIEHVFVDSGELTVTLRVEDEDSGTERTHRIFVADVSPDANLHIEGGRVSEGVAAVFDASRSVAGADSDPIVGYLWDFGDGNTAQGERVEYAWPDDGVFLVRLVVEDSDGSQGADERLLEVRNEAPRAVIQTASDRIEVRAEARFTLEVEDVDADVPVIGWRMGDGTVFANVTRVSHTYAATGIYVVRARIDDGDGGITEVEREVEVTGAAPSIGVGSVVEATEDEPLALDFAVTSAQIEDGVFDGPVDVQVPVLPRGATWEVDAGIARIRTRQVRVRWHPGFGDAGEHVLRVVARAPSGLQRTVDVVIRVADAGTAMVAALGARGTHAYLGLSRIDFDPLRRIDVFEPVAEVALGPGTGSLLVTPDGRRALLSLPGAGALAVVDTSTGRLLRRVPLGGQPFALAWGLGAVWAFDSGAPRLWRIDPGTLKVVSAVELPGLRGVLDAAWLDGTLVAVATTGELHVVDPEAGVVLGTRRLGARLSRVLVAGDEIYVGDTGGRAVLRLDAVEVLDGEVRSTPLDFAPRDLAWVDGAVWIASDAGLTRLEEGRAVQRRRDPASSVAPIAATQLGEPALAVGSSVRVATLTAADLAEVGVLRGTGAVRLIYFVVRR